MGTQITPVQEFSGSLDRMKEQFKTVLPDHITPDKFIRVVKTALALNSDLAMASRATVFSELLKCAQDGLVPDGREAVINIFNSKNGKIAKYIPMVGGICKKARNSGEIKSIDAQVVYENDTFESWIDEQGQHFKHVKARTDRGEAILTYAYAITNEGGFFFEEIDEEGMKAIEGSSKATSMSPWKGPFRDEMKRKSAIRRLAKYRLPSSADLDEVVRRDDDMYDLDRGNEAPAKIASTTPKKLAGLVGASPEATEEEPPIDVPPEHQEPEPKPKAKKKKVEEPETDAPI